MRRAVLDTNVLVSALLHPMRACARLLDLVVDGAVEACVDHRILAEYQEVLPRERLKIPADKIETVLDFFQRATPIVAPPLPITLPDTDDLCFLEVAAAGHAELVTGNPRHFPKPLIGSVVVLTPAEYLESLRRDR